MDFLERLELGDSVMADRGFDIEDMLPEGVTANVPAFLGAREQLDQEKC